MNDRNGMLAIDHLLGRVYRRLAPCDAAGDRVLYLTFDDGPSDYTCDVLQILACEQVKATFFLVAQKACKNPEVVQQIVQAGHSIGNHSMDHHYRHFFKSQVGVDAWIRQSEEQLSALIGEPTVGFRSPVGIQTPPLHRALKSMNMPLIHWNKRFYDRTMPWTPKKALASLNNLQPGSIILLHDCQNPKFAATFMQALTLFIRHAKQTGFAFQPVPKGLGY